MVMGVLLLLLIVSLWPKVLKDAAPLFRIGLQHPLADYVRQQLPSWTTVLLGSAWACLAGWAWALLSAASLEVIIWLVKKLVKWCRKTTFYFTGDEVRGFVAFTIDDAPGRGDPFGSEVLDLLAKYNTKCTFFIISSQVEGREDFLVRCISEGIDLHAQSIGCELSPLPSMPSPIS